MSHRGSYHTGDDITLEAKPHLSQQAAEKTLNGVYISGS